MLPVVRPGRDLAVDVVKGVACLLMVLAHVHFAQAPWLQSVTMATVLFFASTGMNLTGIVERRPGHELRLAANALFLVFAGFADNYIQSTLWMCDVFQSAGLAILAMLLLRRLAPRHWTWLFPVPFLLHLGNQHFHWKVADGGISSFFLTPGLFPLLPWLSFYILGAHLKKYEGERPGWLIGTAALVALAVLALFRPFHFDKFWMSPEYFLIGCVVAGWFFAALRRWMTEGIAKHLGPIRLWGANSLVFYLLNNFVLRLLEMLMPHGVLLFLLSVLVTGLLMHPVLKLQAWASAQRTADVLSAGALAAAAVLTADLYFRPHAYPAFTLVSFALAVAFITCFPAWKNLSRALSARVDQWRGNLPEAAKPAAPVMAAGTRPQPAETY